MIVAFDLSGVFFNNGMKIAVAEISRAYNLNPKDVEFVLDGSFARKYRTGLESPEAYWRRAKERLKAGDIGRIRGIFFNSYHPHRKTITFIEKLRKKGIKTAYISNNPEDRTIYLDRKFSFLSLFDFGLCSFEAHVWKPEKEIYRKFLEKFSLRPDQVIYIDDKEDNLGPAAGLGMKTILFRDIGQLEEDLKKAGLKF
ncbi:MAG: HAD family phosphatase [Candidatus Aenigmarchaeota archaeon]|nr:HAD family phosphatase [Candidatus Aenigmarchaeota archaeon]